MGNGGSSNGESFHEQYDLGRELGKGAQGRVYACVSKDGVKRAVKVIEHTHQKALLTFRREVELCTEGASNNLICILGAFVEPGSLYIVMERFEGNLRQGMKWVVKEQVGRLGDASSRSITRQVLTAIQHLHACEIVHRDVKAHNVFIDRLDVRDDKCRVVLGDLGLARKLEHGRYLSTPVGTRKYWAPEMYDHEVDVFALGVLLFLVVAARYPYADEWQTRHRDAVAEDLPAETSPGVRSFLQLVLQRDVLKRPSSDNLFKHAWLRAVDAVPADDISWKVGTAAPLETSAPEPWTCPRLLSPPEAKAPETSRTRPSCPDLSPELPPLRSFSGDSNPLKPPQHRLRRLKSPLGAELEPAAGRSAGCALPELLGPQTGAPGR